MKRVCFLAVAVILATAARPAHAQPGIISLAAGMKPAVKAKSWATPMPHHATSDAPALSSFASRTAGASTRYVPGLSDRFGRKDMSGKSVGRYSAVRGELSGPSSMAVSRGGANGNGGHLIRGRR